MVSRHERPRFDVKAEARRRALDPPPDIQHVRNRVVGRIQLDGVERGCVEAQPRLGRHRPARIEPARLDERGIGPRADANANRRGQTRLSYTPGRITRKTVGMSRDDGPAAARRPVTWLLVDFIGYVVDGVSNFPLRFAKPLAQVAGGAL